MYIAPSWRHNLSNEKPWGSLFINQSPLPQPFLLKEIYQHFRDHSFTGSWFIAIVVESNRTYCNTGFWRTGLLNLYFKISEEKWMTWISRSLKAEPSQWPGEKFPWVLWRWPSSDLRTWECQVCPFQAGAQKPGTIFIMKSVSLLVPERG